MTNNIDIAAIIHNDGINGPGLRTTVFVQGCKHHCEGCHSEHTWEFNVGNKYTEDDLYRELTKNKLDKGITFSGGDPVYQYKKLINVVKKLKENQYDLMLYTGFSKEELEDMMNKHPKLKDFILPFDRIVTDRFVLAQRDLTIRFRGSRNQRIVKPVLIRGIIDEVILKDITTEFDKCS